MAGTYRCKAFQPTEFNHYAPYSSPDIAITIQELFPRPEIRADKDGVQGGDVLTLSCHTALNPARGATQLQFAFYRNGHNVQGFSSSSNYTIQSARPQDSGNYTCDTAAPSVSVTKGSPGISIHIHGEYEVLIGSSGRLDNQTSHSPSSTRDDGQSDYFNYFTRGPHDEEDISYAALDFKHMQKGQFQDQTYVWLYNALPPWGRQS
ncbi:high affinity immunoglobulin gamma Fc receptor I-like [Xenopus tropicalis]|uniref:high affinity immunoglobulin gamma Fc receptor I-like n=1 Tax=Xenopus tropicalis TaxID=8364 RepID=UPI0012F6B236|nr:high affinity immunoglobulin gamma Fc receptor I-like [Xenopus tropicalis]